jgi:hypothetical protein
LKEFTHWNSPFLAIISALICDLTRSLTMATTVAEGISQVMQPRQFTDRGAFVTGRNQVSELRYALIHEMDREIPVAPGQFSKEIEERQKPYTDVIRACQAWEWTCQSRLDNPNSEMCYGDRANADFPQLLEKVKKFSSNRKPSIPNSVQVETSAPHITANASLEELQPLIVEITLNDKEPDTESDKSSDGEDPFFDPLESEDKGLPQ